MGIFDKLFGRGKKKDNSRTGNINESTIQDKERRKEESNISKESNKHDDEDGHLEDEDIMFEVLELIERVNKYQDSTNDNEIIPVLKISSFNFLERIESKPSCGVAHLGLGLLAKILNDWDDAIKEFELALQDDSHGCYPAYSEPAQLFLNDARQKKEHCSVKQSIDAQILYRMFKMAYDKEKKEKVEQKKAPGVDVVTIKDDGSVSVREGTADELSKIIEADGLVRKGVEYEKSGQWNKAIEQYKRAIELSSNDSRLSIIYTNLGVCYAQIGKINEAIKELETALKIDPSYERARENLHVVKQLK